MPIQKEPPPPKPIAKPSTSASSTMEVSESMYVFEGTDYRQSQATQPTEEDLEAFQKLLDG